MKASTLLVFSILSLGLAACSDDTSSAPTAPAAASPYTDVKAANLTASDRSFLAKLAANADAFSVLSKSGQKAGNSASSNPAEAGRSLASIAACTSPLITKEVDWELGDSVSTDSFPGSIRNIYYDTLTRFDLATGTVNITCNDSASMNGYKEVSRQSNVEGDFLTSFWTGVSLIHINGDFTKVTSLADLANFTFDLTATMKGTVQYTNGFNLEIDTAYFHVAGPLMGLDPKNFDAYFHVNITGYAYSSDLRYNKTTHVMTGDVVRGSDRIGTMTVYENDSLAVKDLDGNLIKP